MAALEKSSVTIETPYLIEAVTHENKRLAVRLKEVRGEDQPTLTVDNCWLIMALLLTNGIFKHGSSKPIVMASWLIHRCKPADPEFLRLVMPSVMPESCH